jgi:hypothetical protein
MSRANNHRMTPAIDKIVIRDFPQLALIAWNRQPDDEITGEDSWHWTNTGNPSTSAFCALPRTVTGSCAIRSPTFHSASRDIIDLTMMIGDWGRIPPVAWDKARKAYGASVDQAWQAAVDLVGERAYLAQCLQKMHMAPVLADRIPDLLRNGR